MGIFENKEDILNKLADLDYELDSLNLPDKLEFVIFGGTALLLWSDFRVTSDIDVIMLNDFSSEEIRELLYKHNVSNSMRSVMEIPPVEEFRFRTRRLNIDFNNLDVLLPSVEDLILSKLFSSRQSDRDEKDLIESDLLEMADMDKLWELYEHYKKDAILPLSRYNNLKSILERREEYMNTKR